MRKAAAEEEADAPLLPGDREPQIRTTVTTITEIHCWRLQQLWIRHNLRK